MIEVALLSDEDLATLLDEARLEYQRRRDLTSAIGSTGVGCLIPRTRRKTLHRRRTMD